MASNKLKINLLHEDADKKARRTTVLVAGLFALFVGLAAAVGASASYRSATQGTSLMGEVGNILSLNDLPWQAQSTPASKDVAATPDDRLNVLLLGIGGEGHDGPLLTDTIILASFDTKNDRIGLVSIPRDLAYPLGGGKFEKINAVNAYAEQDHPGQGAELTAQAFSTLFNVRIDRVVRIDFQGFAKFIDSLGGVDVNVARSFTDTQFPTSDLGPNPNKVTTVHFDKGMQHMSGATALTFARSRHGNNGEDSDFARSARQQLIISAARGKLFSLGVMSDPQKLSDLWGVISSHVETNMSIWDAVRLMPLAAHFKDTPITQNTFTDDPDGALVAGNVDGSFLLFPKNPDWSDLRKVIDDPFSSPAQQAQQLRPTHAVTIEVKNGTLVTGLAAAVSEKLGGYGYSASVGGNASSRDNDQTVIYDLTGGSDPSDLAKLKQLLNANVSASTPYDGYVLDDAGEREKVTGTSTQFMVVLGASSENLTQASAYANP